MPALRCLSLGELLQDRGFPNMGTSSNTTRKMTMGLIVGNRGFFPDHLAKTGREEMTQVLQSAGIDVVVLGPEQSKHGAVETHEEAKRCVELFKSQGGKI